MRADPVAIEDLDAGWRELYEAALVARKSAYAPYSRFSVGAAVRMANGEVFSGSNIENASYGLTVCAERVAIWKAVSAGQTELQGLVVVTDAAATPCGACRQVMLEFVPDMPILVADTEGHGWWARLAELLPDAFPRMTYGDDQEWRGDDRARRE